MAKKESREALPEDIRMVLDDLESRKEFQEWKRDHKSHRLAYLFTEFQPGQEPEWQVGYFKGRRMTTFTLSPKLKIEEDQEVYESGNPLVELDLSIARVSFEKAMGIAEGLTEEKQPFTPSHVLAILQTVDDRPVWNITLVSREYMFLNAKIDVSSGEVVKHQLSPLFSMASSMEGKGLPKAG